MHRAKESLLQHYNWTPHLHLDLKDAVAAFFATKPLLAVILCLHPTLLSRMLASVRITALPHPDVGLESKQIVLYGVILRVCPILKRISNVGHSEHLHCDEKFGKSKFSFGIYLSPALIPPCPCSVVLLCTTKLVSSIKNRGIVNELPVLTRCATCMQYHPYIHAQPSALILRHTQMKL